MKKLKLMILLSVFVITVFNSLNTVSAFDTNFNLENEQTPTTETEEVLTEEVLTEEVLTEEENLPVEENEEVETTDSQTTDSQTAEEEYVVEEYDKDSEGRVEDENQFIFDENGNITGELNPDDYQAPSVRAARSLPATVTQGYLDFSPIGSQIINVYANSTTTTAYTYFNSGSSVRVPTLGQVGNRIRVVINGYDGYINYSSSYSWYSLDFVNTNQNHPSYNFREYYTVNSSGDLIYTYDYYGNNTSIVVGKAPNYLSVSVPYYSFDGIYFYTSRSTLFSNKLNNVVSGSLNATTPFYNYYEYLPFRSKTNLTTTDMKNYLNTKLAGRTSVLNSNSVLQTFMTSQDKYSVNAALEFSIGMLESGYGTSNIALTKNNLFGWGSVDSGPYAGSYKFSSVEAGVDYHFKNALSDSYLDNYSDSRYYGGNLGNKNGGVNVKYASDPFWGKKISGLYYLMDKQAGFKDYNYYMIAIKSNNSSPAATFNGDYVYNLKNTKSNTSIINMPFLVTSFSGGTMNIESDVAICNNGDTSQHPQINSSTGSLNISYPTCNLNKPSYAAQHKFSQDIVNVSKVGFNFTGNSTPKLPGISGAVSATSVTVKESSKTTFDVVVNGVKSNDGVAGIRVPVWTELNGQDDLIWYDAVKQSNGSYLATIDISDHNNEKGKYIIHVYGLNNAGLENPIKAANIYLSTIELSSVDVYENTIYGSFDIILSGITSTNGINELSVAVWTDKNSQDDLNWHTAVKQSDDTYKVSVNNTNHLSEFGLYNIHVYGKDKSNVSKYLNKTTFDFKNTTSNNVTINNVINDDYSGFTTTITFNNITLPSNITSIKVPIWSKNNGQDELIWYNAIKKSEGEYTVNVKISNHKYDFNDYIIHVYANDVNGKSNAIKASSVNLPEQKISISNVVTKINSNNLGFEIKLSGITAPRGVNKITVPVWSDNKGQDDLKWYTAIRQVDGSYVVNVNIANHNYDNGKYIIHIYAIDNVKKQSYISSTSIIINTVITVSDLKMVENLNKTGFSVIISGVTAPLGVNSISVPIWTEKGGQDDIIWYTATKQVDGSYRAEVKVANHKGEYGKYIIHVYGKNQYLKSNFIKSSTYHMTDYSIKSNSIKVVKNSSNNGFKVIVSNISAPLGVKSIQVPVWTSRNGQDDLIWYTAVLQSDGTYVVNILKLNHKNESGLYNIHIYGKNNNGLENTIGGTTFIL